MEPFSYKNNEFYCEEVDLQEIASKVGTPVYVYSYQALKDRFHRYDAAFAGMDHLICYSMKANSSQAVMKTFFKEGSGIDVVTGGELYRALRAGCDPKKIVFSGIGKSADEIRKAIEVDILQFNVESEGELAEIQKVASSMNKKAPIALRVNPDVDPETHPYISTGLEKNKFGISHSIALDLYEKASGMSHIEVVGIDFHIGSQLTSVTPFVDAIERVKRIIAELKQSDIQLKYLDVGGGLGITYKDEKPPTPEDYAKAIQKELAGSGLKLILEPGRGLVGNGGILLTRVLYNKKGTTKNFVIVDAASNDLMRPSLYDAYHHIQPVCQYDDRKSLCVDVVGPICETGDFFAEDRQLQAVQAGELLAIMSSGAYGFSMSSTYNSRPRCAEVMVNGNDFFVVRERESIEDLTRGERVPEFLR